MGKGILILVFIYFIVNQVSAQKKWTLQQCLDSALSKNLNLRQSSNSSEIGRINYQQSKYNMLPQINASANQSFNFHKVKDTETGNYSSEGYKGNNFSVSGSMVLFNGLQNKFEIKENESNYKAATYDFENMKNQLIIDVLNAYMQIIFAFESIKNSENQVNASNEQIKITEVFVKTGKQSESNLLMIKSQLSTDKLTLVNSGNQLKTAKLNLQQLMEISVNDDFDIEYNTDLKLPDVIDENVSAIYQSSVSVLPVVKAYQQRVMAEEYALKSTKNSWMPTLMLNGNLSTNYSGLNKQIYISDGSSGNVDNAFNNQFKNNMMNSMSLSLSIPIFSRHQIISNIKIQQIRLENAKVSERLGNNILRKEIEMAYNDLTNASAKYEAVNEQLVSIKASYDNSKTRYDAGIMNATDLLIEKNKLAKAESDLLQAKFELIFKSKILDYYKGNKIAL